MIHLTYTVNCAKSVIENTSDARGEYSSELSGVKCGSTLRTR